MSYALTTVVMIVGLHNIQIIAAPTRRKYALDSSIRVPAHVTLLYPFVAFDQLNSACRKLREVLTEVEPFEITLDGYDHFPTVAFMKVANPVPIQNIFRKIYAAFPECPPYGGLYGNDLHPHMTVGEFRDQSARDAAILPDYPATTFRAERVHVLYGIDGESLPWITYEVIALGIDQPSNNVTL